jgi:hypothetical protein
MAIDDYEIECVEAMIEQVMIEYYRDTPVGEEITPVEFARRLLKRIFEIVDIVNERRQKH